METIQAFFNKLFFEMTHEDSIFILTFLLISFLIGVLFGWWQGISGKKKLRKTLQQKESELVSLKASHATMEEQLELKEADLTKVNLELENLKSTFAVVENEKAQLHSDLITSGNQLESLKSENLNHLSEIDALNNEIETLKSRLNGQSDHETKERTNDYADVDLTKVQSNYDNANIRIAAIEEKLSRIERENYTLKNEISSMKDSSSIAFLDDDPMEDDDLELESISESVEGLTGVQDRSFAARQKLKNAFGTRISIATLNERDDLKKINGIGPFIEQKLNDIGIYTFKQISQFDNELINQITDAIEFFPGRIERDDWVGQAKRLA